MRIALATCVTLPTWEADDHPLHDALAARGVEVVHAVWSDESLDWSSFDACLVRTTWDYPEHHAAFLAWAERVGGVTALHNPLDVIRRNTHKSYLRDLEAAGAPIAPTVWLPRGERADLAAILSERRWERAFIKPAVGLAAWRTMRVAATDGELDAAQAHLDELLECDDVLLQPYLERVETDGELSVIFVDGAVTHAVRKIPVPGDYRVQDDFGASDEPATLTEGERDLARRVMAAAGAGGLLYGRVDFLRDSNGSLVVTEVELVEPSLFFRHAPHAAERLADALCARVEGAA